MALDLDLGQFLDFISQDGRQFGPFIQREGDDITAVNVPNTVALRDLKGDNPEDIAQIQALLRRFDRDNNRTRIDAQKKFLAGFGITSGDPRYRGEMLRLGKAQGGRALLAEARRTSEKYETAIAAQGNPNQQFMRVAEGPDPCELCEEETGEEGTYRELAAQGLLPGGSSCLGGDLCLCVLVPIE
jgi:hypothetical protein